MGNLEAVVAIVTAIAVGSDSGGSRVRESTPTVAMYATGPRPRSIAIADLDGDGRRDVVVACSGDDTVQLVMGAADGQLRHRPPSISAGNDPSDVETVDVDRDGDADLVVANHETSKITVLINDGRANFKAAADSPYESGARPHIHGLATGDFDGDGWIDFAVESADTRELRVFTGGATGFSDAKSVPVGTMPYSRLGAADVTGDGRVEILVPGHGNNSVLVVADGQRVLTSFTTSLPAQPWMVVGDDVNGDHRADVVAVVSDGVAVLLAAPNGLTPAPGSPFAVTSATEVATGDLDGDGIADIVVGPWEGNEVTILTGGTFSRRTVRTCARPIGLAVSDLNGDGRGELVAACSSENRLVVVNLATGHGAVQHPDSVGRPPAGG